MTYVARNTGVVTEWQAYSPTSPFTNSTASGQYRRVGNFIQLHIGVAFTGTPSASPLRFTEAQLLNGLGLTVDLSLDSGDESLITGTWSAIDTSVANYSGVTAFRKDRVLQLLTPTIEGSTTTPFSIGNTDRLSIDIMLPIVGWIANVQQADRALEEYAYNTSLTTADDTTSFGYGPAGTQFPTGSTPGGTFDKTVQFLTPILPTDRLVLEVSADSGARWVALGDIAGAAMIGTHVYTNINSKTYGLGFGGFTSSTQARIRFGRWAELDYLNATFGADGLPWNTAVITTARWRVRKVSGGGSVGFPLSGKNIIPEETLQPVLVSSSNLTFGLGVRLVSSGTPTTQTLPTITAADDGRRIAVKNVGSGTATIATSGGALIDGQSTQALNQYESVNLMAYNGNWLIL